MRTPSDCETRISAEVNRDRRGWVGIMGGWVRDCRGAGHDRARACHDHMESGLKGFSSDEILIA